MKLNFNINNEVDMPELVLGKRNYDKIGSITNIEDFSYEYHFMSADKIDFSVYKTVNGQESQLWDKLRDRRLVWVKEFDEWFEITVDVNEEDSLRKDIVGTSLCEAELSQTRIPQMEINSEDDIAREDYEVTIFYNPSLQTTSLLHRILKKVPHYSIGHVDESLWKIQRTFSFSNMTVYDILNEIAEEIGCLFLFDSTSRTINVYDLQTNCNNCEHRGDFTDICPECGSTDLVNGYGQDTTIYVDKENLAQNISLNGQPTEVKNYFRVIGGDDIINAAVAACNPTGTNYIAIFSNEDKEDMSEDLRSKLVEYESTYTERTEEYKAIMQDLYDTIDEQLYLESGMMPNITMAETNASQELAKLTTANLSPVAVTNINTVSVYTANSAVLSMAKCIANSTIYKITIIDGSYTLSEDKIWSGKFRIENSNDEDDYAENTEYIQVAINGDYQAYVEQKIQKSIDRDDTYLVDIFDNHVLLSTFSEELKKYCLNRLISFESAYQSVIDVLISADCANSKTYPDIYTNIYLPYYQKLTAIQSEIKIRSDELDVVNQKYADLIASQNAIQSELSLENYLGTDLWKELCTFIREDTYENSNYISDGLDNNGIFQKAEELLDVAIDNLNTAHLSQWTLSATLYNLLAMPEFADLVTKFNGGNWIRVGINEKVYRLRLIYYKIIFSEIQNLQVEFSEATQTANGMSDVRNLMNHVENMTTSFSSVAQQAKQGSKSYSIVDTIRKEGLNTALYNISNAINQQFLIDEHGILGREYDDILGDYSPEQVKFVNNGIVFTDDYWETAKEAIGKFTYYDPIDQIYKESFGVIADVLIGNLILSDTVGIYNEASNISLDKNGLTITANGDDLENSPLFTIQRQYTENNETILQKILYLNENGDFALNGSILVQGNDDSTDTLENRLNNPNITDTVNNLISINNTNLGLNDIYDAIDESRELVQENLNTFQNTVEKYLSFDSENGLKIGSAESNFATVIDNESMSFLDGDEKVAYISNQQLYINQAIVNTLFSIGNYNFAPREDGTLSIVWKS